MATNINITSSHKVTLPAINGGNVIIKIIRPHPCHQQGHQ